MVYSQLVNNFLASWAETRKETEEILNSLSDKDLQFKPARPKWKLLSSHFLCIIQTQIAYSNGILKGKMNFSDFDVTDLLDKGKNKKALKTLLITSNKEWVALIKTHTKDLNTKISWPNYDLNLLNHILALSEHERLHHGQLISYFTLAGIELPKNFKANWAL